MEEDDRFNHLANDPRFRTLRKQQRKVIIDKRFESMFTDKRFTLKYKRDKRGRVIDKKTGDDLKHYYDIDYIDPKELENQEEDADDESSSDEASSSSSDESSDEEGNEGGYLDPDWNDLDKDALKTDQVTSRIAICNVDWYRLNAVDLFVVVSSFRKAKSLTIYLSKFGRERLGEEERRGPTELVELPTIPECESDTEQDDDDKDSESSVSDESDADDESDDDTLIGKTKDKEQKKRRRRKHAKKSSRTNKRDENVLAINHYEDEEDADNVSPEVAERIRKYQINRLKYYYAVVEFDSCEDANHVYNELDGMEYEGSSSALDLRFIPDDMSFDGEQVHSECHQMPDLVTYQAPQFITTALQQSTVRLTWDETDPKRRGKLRKTHTQEELEKDDLDAYLASETSDSESELENENLNSGFNSDNDDDVDADDSDADCDEKEKDFDSKSKKKVAKYRQLLKEVEEEQRQREKVDVEIEWDDGLEDENSKKVENLKSKKPKNAKSLSNDDESDEYDDDSDNLNPDEDKNDDDDDKDFDDDDVDEDNSHENDLEIEQGKQIDYPLDSDEFNDKDQRRKYNKKDRRQRHLKLKNNTTINKEIDPALDLMVMDTNDGNDEQRKHFNYRRITGEEKGKRKKKYENNDNHTKKSDDFEFNPEDERFQAVYESHMYNIDPSDCHFKRTSAYEELAKRKRQRRGFA